MPGSHTVSGRAVNSLVGGNLAEGSFAADTVGSLGQAGDIVGVVTPAAGSHSSDQG